YFPSRRVRPETFAKFLSLPTAETQTQVFSCFQLFSAVFSCFQLFSAVFSCFQLFSAVFAPNTA
ncbi:hypothetical protein, partial [Neisseria meningitidis]|uniref:hypothetical protein n=1 Tax=Neisseria meningitidis TaxID=487 RepID=UPI00398A0242